ncbi:hypothetical protein NUW54_g4155 [Trametes sanguinea]|uniref:Uncharacterized protein n=1 Tax=Trametes sanguinea TaxID=158606 RepID=A0ACC1Q0B3_9APHY|nr:hypothetical protein NUW54_g4155 [Trametes sanguinea]
MLLSLDSLAEAVINSFFDPRQLLDEAFNALPNLQDVAFHLGFRKGIEKRRAVLPPPIEVLNVLGFDTDWKRMKAPARIQLLNALGSMRGSDIRCGGSRRSCQWTSATDPLQAGRSLTPTTTIWTFPTHEWRRRGPLPPHNLAGNPCRGLLGLWTRSQDGTSAASSTRAPLVKELKVAVAARRLAASAARR